MGAVLVLLVVFMPQGLSGTIAPWSTGAREGDEMQPAPAADTSPLFQAINVSKTLWRVQGAQRCFLPRQ